MNRIRPDVSVFLLIACLLSTGVGVSIGAIRPGDPIEYNPFYPDRWEQQNVSRQLVPWEGQAVVLLTTTADLDGKVMASFLERLDGGWELYADLTGRNPDWNKQYHGKMTIAALPSGDLTCGYGCGNVGATGIEVTGFYAEDYPLVAATPQAFPHYYFYEMGRNYYTFQDRHSLFVTGFAVFLRYVCMDTLACTDVDQETRRIIEQAEGRLAQTDLSFLDAFTTLGGMEEKTARLPDHQPSDQPVMYASVMLKLARENGGNDWVRRFFRSLGQCPAVEPATPDDALGQSLLWLVSSSCAARRDLSGLFADRWRMPLGVKTRAVLANTNWKQQPLDVRTILYVMPAEELPFALAVQLPGFLTEQRRRTNRIADGSFEARLEDHWSVHSWRNDERAVTVVYRDARQGRRAVQLQARQADDVQCRQTVAVKPNTRYLLSGWIKTRNVEIAEKNGRHGAHLSIDGAEAGESLVGTNDWTYVTRRFDSAARTEAEICIRLGHHGSTARGIAWFDEICLIELD
ncbi:MAG: hypothetical protein JW810_08055 [Sedimentisphaerales bacterium]|nr:hypothetical protein [Sedimentisphaerales bacterium]